MVKHDEHQTQTLKGLLKRLEKSNASAEEDYEMQRRIDELLVKHIKDVEHLRAMNDKQFKSYAALTKDKGLGRKLLHKELLKEEEATGGAVWKMIQNISQ